MTDPSTSIRKDYHALTRSDVFPVVPVEGGTLLDVGGGIGATAAALKSLGRVDRAGVIDIVKPEATAEGLDFHYSANLEAPDSLDEIIAAEGPFSVILCLDVLEHLSDPWEIVARLHKALVPGGVIIASIPNIRNYKASFPLFFQGKWELEESGIRDRTHLRWFVRKTAIELMTSSGLRLEEVLATPSGGRKIKLIRLVTLGILSSFTDLQYVVRVRNTAS